MVNPIYQQDEELLLNPFGSRYLSSDTGTYTDVNSNEFIVQEDTVISVLTGGDASISENSIDYKASMNLSGVTLKKGALIVAPVGEAFKSITIDSGSIMAYNCVVGGTKPGSFVGLLDDYPDAAVAYSLRKLRSDYSDSAIRIRVDTAGQPTYDIGFDSNGELDTADLVSKAAGNSAYVDILYDQSGNGNNATQSTASKQPVIVSSGVVNELNGKPTMTFLSPFLMDLNLSQYPFTSGGSATEKSIFAVAENDATANQNLYNIADTRDIYALTYNRSANNTYGFFGANYGTIGGNITGQNIISSLAISPSSKTFNNTVEGVSSNLVRANFNDISIGSRGGSYAMDGSIQEIVMYESNQSTNRENIETNINDYYNVY